MALIVYQIGGFITGAVAFNLWTVVAVVLLAGLLYLVLRPYRESTTLRTGDRSVAHV